MSSAYHYDDPDAIYSDPATGVLRNKLGVTDPDVLRGVESLAVARRLAELDSKPIPVTGAKSLLDIHRYLFQDIYTWAGEPRKVNISKSGRPFLEMSFFDTGLIHIDSLVARYRTVPRNPAQDAAALAEMLDAVNHMHPFREGNGRAQREFVRSLALEKGYSLSLNPPDDKAVYTEYMKGTADGDRDALTALIKRLLQ